MFSGDPGAPAQSFSATSGLAGGTAPYTTLATSPVTQEEPFLQTDPAGQYSVFVPALQHNSSGPSWAERPRGGHVGPDQQVLHRHAGHARCWPSTRRWPWART